MLGSFGGRAAWRHPASLASGRGEALCPLCVCPSGRCLGSRGVLAGMLCAGLSSGLAQSRPSAVPGPVDSPAQPHTGLMLPPLEGQRVSQDADSLGAPSWWRWGRRKGRDWPRGAWLAGARGDPSQAPWSPLTEPPKAPSAVATQPRHLLWTRYGLQTVPARRPWDLLQHPGRGLWKSQPAGRGASAGPCCQFTRPSPPL